MCWINGIFAYGDQAPHIEVMPFYIPEQNL